MSKIKRREKETVVLVYRHTKEETEQPLAPLILFESQPDEQGSGRMMELYHCKWLRWK